MPNIPSCIFVGSSQTSIPDFPIRRPIPALVQVSKKTLIYLSRLRAPHLQHCEALRPGRRSLVVLIPGSLRLKVFFPSKKGQVARDTTFKGPYKDKG